MAGRRRISPPRDKLGDRSGPEIRQARLERALASGLFVECWACRECDVVLTTEDMVMSHHVYHVKRNA